jgi:hypothetical protein
MKTVGLIFIPDISGFTRFVKQVEVEHSRLIIQELLEIMIDSNTMGLEVSEVEGDAILFYRFGEKPTFEEVYRQVKKMFIDFHRNLMEYESRRYCQCDACLSAIDLTLKVITHYGEFTEYHVKNFNKLIGKDVIVAHQLLKNDITKHEYWLLTDELSKDFKGDNDTKLQWIDSVKRVEEGDIHFRYAQLGFLKNKISVAPPRPPDLSRRTRVISLTHEYDTDIITLLHVAADFTYRSQWMEAVVKVEVQNHFLPRIGHRAILSLRNGKSIATIANHYIFDESMISFSEIDEGSGDLSYCTLEKKGDYRTRLTLTYYISRPPFSQLLFKLRERRALKDRLARSFKNIEQLVLKLGESVRSKLR